MEHTRARSPPPMSLILQIIPFNDELDMFGEPDPVSAYSLSGHVSISLASSFSFFESRRPSRLLLQSLSLTFEGQSEIFTHSTGYSSVRLCSTTHELVPPESIELTNDGDEESSVWNIVFNLPIPGWLPGSSAHGEGDFGVKYTLAATARFMSLDTDNSISSWSPFSALCAPFRPRFRSAETCKTVKLRRFVNPPKAEAVEVPKINYLVNSSLSGIKKDDKNKIPAEVLASIQVLVSVPEHIDLKAKEVPLSIRLRTKNLSEEECNKVQLTTTSLDITQHEEFRCRPSPSYLAQYPIPPKEMQPPNLPLHDSHPMNYIYPDLFSISHKEISTRTFSLLPGTESGKFKLDENNYLFKDDRNEDIPTWYTINVSLPFDNGGTTGFDSDGTFSWSDFVGLRASTCEPLYNVHHQLAISLTIQYDQDSGVVKEKLNFKVPLTFANVAPRIPTPSANLTIAGNTSVQNISSPSPPLLPPYSQLYHRNGERKIDYTVPLPLYTPKACKDDSSQIIEERSPLFADQEKPLVLPVLAREAEQTTLVVQ